MAPPRIGSTNVSPATAEAAFVVTTMFALPGGRSTNATVP